MPYANKIQRTFETDMKNEAGYRIIEGLTSPHAHWSIGWVCHNFLKRREDALLKCSNRALAFIITILKGFCTHLHGCIDL